MSRSRSQFVSVVGTAVLGAILSLSPVAPAAADPGDPGEPVVLDDDRWSDRGPSVSPDSEWVLSLPEREDGDEPQTLQSQPIRGGDVVQLSADPFSGGGFSITESILEYVVTDGGLVVQTSRTEEPRGPIRLTAVPVSGGLRAELDTGIGGTELLLSGDHSHVVYVGQEGVLRSIALPGGDPMDLGVTVISGLQGSVLVPVGDDRVVVWGRESGDADGRLWLVPVAGGPATPLTAPAPAARSPRSVTVAGDRVVFVADHRFAGVRELWSARLSGTGAVRLSRDMPPGGDVKELVVTPDGEDVIFRADQRTNNVNELWRVSVDGGPTLRLSRKLVTGGDVKSGFAVADDGSVVVYRADARRNNQRELFGTDIDGSGHWRYNKRLPVGGDVNEAAVVGSTVVFRADQRVNNAKELFAIPLRDGSLTVLSGPLAPRDDVQGRGTGRDFVVSPDGSVVAYATRGRNADGQALHLAPITGGAPVQLSDPALDSVRGPFWFSPDSAWVGWGSFDEAHRARAN